MSIMNGMANALSLSTQRLQFVRFNQPGQSQADARAVTKLSMKIDQAQQEYSISERRALYDKWLSDPTSAAFIKESPQLMAKLERDTVFVDTATRLAKVAGNEQPAQRAQRSAPPSLSVGTMIDRLSRFTRVNGNGGSADVPPPKANGGSIYFDLGALRKTGAYNATSTADRLNLGTRVNVRA